MLTKHTTFEHMIAPHNTTILLHYLNLILTISRSVRQHLNFTTFIDLRTMVCKNTARCSQWSIIFAVAAKLLIMNNSSTARPWENGYVDSSSPRLCFESSSTIHLQMHTHKNVKKTCTGIFSVLAKGALKLSY